MMPRPGALFFILCLCIASTSKVVSQVSNQALIPFLQENQYGYSNWNGDLIIPTQYDEAELFDVSSNYAVVQQNEKWYIINKHGEKLKDFVYDCKPEIVIPFDNNSYKPNTMIIQDSSLLSKNFRIIKPANSCDGEGKDIYAFSLKKFKAKNIVRTDQHKTERGYHSSAFSHGMMIAYEKDNKGYTLYDKHLDSILYSKVRPHFLNEHLVYYLKKNNAHVYDLQTKTSTKTSFKFIGHFINDKYLLVFTGYRYSFSSMHKNKISNQHWKGSSRLKYKYGLCDLDYNLLIDTVFTNLEVFENNHIIGLDGNYHHLYDSKGDIIISNAEKITRVEDHNTYIVTDTLGKVSLYNGDGEAIDNQIFDKLHYNKYTRRYEYTKGGISGILDSNLNVLFQYPCEGLSQRKHPNYFVFMHNGKQGLLNKNGTQIIPPKHTHIYLNKGFVKLGAGRYSGLADLKGRVLLDTIYNSISIEKLNPTVYDYKDDLWIEVKKDGQTAYFDSHLDTILPFQQNKNLTFIPNIKPLSIKEKEELKHSPIYVSSILIKISFQNGEFVFDEKEILYSFQTTVNKFITLLKSHLDQNALIIVGDGKGKNYAFRLDASPLTDNRNRILNIIRINTHKKMLTYEVDGAIGTVNYNGEILKSEKKPLDLATCPLIQYKGLPMEEGRWFPNFIGNNNKIYWLHRYPEEASFIHPTKSHTEESSYLYTTNASHVCAVHDNSKNKLRLSKDKFLTPNLDGFGITDVDGSELFTFKGWKANRVDVQGQELLEVLGDGKKYYIDPNQLKKYKY